MWLVKRNDDALSQLGGESVGHCSNDVTLSDMWNGERWMVKVKVVTPLDSIYGTAPFYP